MLWIERMAKAKSKAVADRTQVLTFRYRLRLRSNQRRAFEAILDQQRWLYNEALEWRKLVYDQYKISLGYVDQCRWLTHLRSASNVAAVPVSLQRATLARFGESRAARSRDTRDSRALIILTLLHLPR